MNSKTLMNLNPFVHSLNYEFKSILCDFCFTKNKLFQCSSCKYVHYCGKDCQKKDWDIHKTECKKFAAANSAKTISKLNDEMIRIYLRVLIKSLDGQDKLSDEFGLKTLDTLMDHYDDLVKDLKLAEKMYECFGTIKLIMGEEFFYKFNIKKLISYFGKLKINAFSISNYDLSQTLGSGIYLSASTLNHSCYPNCAIIFDGVKLSVKCIRKYDENAEEPTISYSEILLTRNERKKYLLENYYFDCKCPKCIEQNGLDDRLNLIKCKSCSNYSFKLNDFVDLIRKCAYCEKSNKAHIDEANALAKQIEVLIEKIQKELAADKLSMIGPNHQNINSQNLASLIGQTESLIKKSLNCFDNVEVGDEVYLKRVTENLFIIKLYEALLDLYVSQEDFGKASSLGECLLAIYGKFYPENHPSLALLMLKLSKIHLNENSMENAYNYLKKAEKIFEITHNKEHSIYADINELNCLIKI